MEKYYDVFHRTWWAERIGELVPCPGRKTYPARHVTFADARMVADRYNTSHTPGRLSRKAEIKGC